MNIKENEPYSFSCNGEDLAKVLLYYGLIPDANSYEQKIVCPFHKDVNPSMIVNFETGTFFCFGCNISGDAYKFVETMYKDDNAIQTLIKYFKILKSDKVEKLDFSKRFKKSKKQDKELYAIAYDYYHGLSKIDWTKDANDEVKQCSEYMIQRGFTLDTLNKCKAKVTYNKSYPIIFPMLDNGKFKGWVCRTNDKEIEQKRKYLYNEGFSRATTLVGNYKDCEYVFVVEGYMDRLKFIQNGIDNVVAILGWKMSYEQEQKLKSSGVKYIISALDNDECGKKGTKYLRKIFPDVIRYRYLKGFKDPGGMDKKTFRKTYEKTLKDLAQYKQKR